MPYSVTSWFLSQLDAKASKPQRRFLIGTSDYSDYVMAWPQIRRAWDDVRPQAVTIKLANADQAFNAIRANKTILARPCYVKFGFTHPNSGDELITLFTGAMDKVRYPRGQCSITLLDKFKQLSERVVGTQDVPVTYTDSTLPSDIAWDAVTCYGGLSSVASDSNPDVNYQSWLDWAAVFSADNLYMNANLDGIKVTELLQRMSRQTLSAIYTEEGRVAFKRFSAADSNSTTLTVDDLLEPADVEIDDEDIINRQYVYGGYVPTSDSWGIQVLDVVSASVNTYGAREQIEKDDALWWVNSSGCANLAARIVGTAGEPYDRVNLRTGLKGAIRQVGETIVLDEPFFGGAINGGYRIKEYALDLDKGVFSAKVDASQYGSPFILDSSALDGSDQLL